jgi:hypothetical protein
MINALSAGLAVGGDPRAVFELSSPSCPSGHTFHLLPHQRLITVGIIVS